MMFLTSGNFFEEIVGTIPLSKDSDLVNQVQTLKNITRSIHWTSKCDVYLHK